MKNPNAVALGRLGGLKRARNLTAAQLSAIGKKGGRPRKQPMCASEQKDHKPQK